MFIIHKDAADNENDVGVVEECRRRWEMENLQ